MNRPALMIGAAILVAAVGATGAWLTRPPETAQPRLSKAAKARLAEASRATPTARPAATIALPEATPPPQPTSADFTRSDAPPQAATATKEPGAPAAGAAIDWPAMAIDELRSRASADEIHAMEELARRLVHGAGVAKDQQAGAGWLLRAAQRGSAQSAFNVGVMYERGFVVERDSTKAVEWYRKAVDANLAMAKHNLALLLRDGKGAPRDGKEAVELLRSAARQGMAASMFSLGDIYERGDAGFKDSSIALAWFAIAAEFERQTSRTSESALGKLASQRMQVLQRVLMPGELERAQQFGQAEFKQIVEGLQPPKPVNPAPTETAAAPLPALPTPAAEPDPDPPGWPKAVNDQIRVIQQALVDLKFLRDKPDGAMGPMTRNAIRAFQRGVPMRETGEPTREVFVALQEEAAKAEAAKAAAAKAEAAKAEAAKVEAAKAEAAKAEAAKAAAAKAEAAKAEAAKAEAAKAEAGKVEAAKAEAAKAEAAKAAAAKAEAAKAEAAKAEAAKAEAAKVEAAKVEQARIESQKIDPPKPPLPKIDATKPTMPVVAASPEPAKAEPAQPASLNPAVATITLNTPEPPPPPTSADLARLSVKSDLDAWPTTTVDQVKAIQALLRDLKFSREAPDGLLGPATRTAIRDYERSLGLAQTGEPSKMLFDSLKEMRSLTATKPN